MSAEKKSQKRREFKDFILTTLIGGVLVMLPLAILIVVFKWMFNILVGFVRPVTGLLTFGGKVDLFLANLIAISILILLCFGMGLLVRTAGGKYLYHVFEDRVLSRLPLYKSIRDTIKLFSERDKMPFSRVVLVNVFNSDTLMTGFITDTHSQDWYTVFVPTGPNPTNGFVFHVKAHQFTEIDVPPEDAIKSVIGVGAGSKPLFEAYFRKS